MCSGNALIHWIDQSECCGHDPAVVRWLSRIFPSKSNFMKSRVLRSNLNVFKWWILNSCLKVLKLWGLKPWVLKLWFLRLWIVRLLVLKSTYDLLSYEFSRHTFWSCESWSFEVWNQPLRFFKLCVWSYKSWHQPLSKAMSLKPWFLKSAHDSSSWESWNLDILRQPMNFKAVSSELVSFDQVWKCRGWIRFLLNLASVEFFDSNFQIWKIHHGIATVPQREVFSESNLSWLFESKYRIWT